MVCDPRPKPERRATSGMTGDGADPELLVAALVRLGASEEAADAAVRRGDPEQAVFEPVLARGRLERTVGAREIEARGGLGAGEIAEIMRAFGLPPVNGAEPMFTPAEADAFVRLGALRGVWPQEATLQLARVYGRMLARIAATAVQCLRFYSVPLLRERNPDPVSELRAARLALEHLLPLADPLLAGVHRRWVEHEVAQAVVGDAERRVGASRLPGAIDLVFLFCDLKDFTAYAEVEGDAAAMAAVDEFFIVVTRERGETGRIVKTLGDGAMLAYDDPAAAVAAGARIIEAVARSGGPGVHASVHSGVAIARDGDFFGGAVNVAARLLARARRDELLATRVVAEATGSRFAWAATGAHRLRGVASPVEVFRLDRRPPA